MLLTCSCGSVGGVETHGSTFEEFPECLPTEDIEQIDESILICEELDDLKVDQYAGIDIPPEYVQENVTVYESEYPVPLAIERVDRSILSDEGTLAGITYYDKPVLFGETGVVDTINTYFENDCHEFFFGQNKMNFYGLRVYEFFQGTVYRDLGLYGSFARQNPFYNTVETELKYSSDEFLSFVYKTYWTVGGVSTHYCFGDTFDMRTGELITLDHFISLDIAQFRDMIKARIIMRYKKWDGDDERYIASKCEYLNEALAKMEYGDFEYYYDGNEICLLLNSVVFSSGCYLFRWDIATGELSDRVQMFIELSDG